MSEYGKAKLKFYFMQILAAGIGEKKKPANLMEWICINLFHF